MGEQKFYLCKHCKNLAGLVHNAGVPMVCCGEKMTELVANTVDASAEKHLPVVSVQGNTVQVTVGSVEHPMAQEHHIAFIYLQTNEGGQRKNIATKAAPRAVFALAEGETAQAAFAYCNLHGLWKTEL